MPYRCVLTSAERAALLGFPTERSELIRLYSFSEQDLSVINKRSREDREKLAVPETEGVYFTTNRPDRGLIRYFIEKDFPCIHPRAAEALEGPSETFAPPPALFPRNIVGLFSGISRSGFIRPTD
jgi:hypothetical protein